MPVVLDSGCLDGRGRVGVDNRQITAAEAADSRIRADQLGAVRATLPPTATDGPSINVCFDPRHGQGSDQANDWQYGAEQQPADESSPLRLRYPAGSHGQQSPTQQPYDFHARSLDSFGIGMSPRIALRFG